MAKKTQHLKPDTVLKKYWNNNEQFADLFNAVLFDGKQIIKADELEDLDTEESSILEHREYTESITASRDNIKVRKLSSAYGMEFVLLGKEDQEHIHYAMPMRVMGYDYGSYKKQYDSNARKYKTSNDMNADEYLSRMKKSDRLIPVITLTLYYGEKPWDGATSLHEMLNIPKGMERFVNDYKILLVEARKNNLTLHNLNNVDLFNLFEIILDNSIPKNEAKELIIQYCEEHKTDKTVIMTIAGAANVYINYNAFEKGDGNMCTLFDEIAKESEAKGIEQGIEQGIQALIESLQDLDIPFMKSKEQLMTKFLMSEDNAQKYMDKFWK